MSLNAEERQIMSNLEMERAERILNTEVPVALSAQLWNMLANRLHYAAFHAVSALLIRNQIVDCIPILRDCGIKAIIIVL